MADVRLSRRGVLLAALLAAGCSSAPKRPTIETLGGGSDDEDPARKALREILDRRAKAVLEKNERAYLADLDPSAQKLIERERMVFRNLRQFKFSEFRFITEKALNNDPTAGKDVYGPIIRVARLTADTTSAGVSPAETFRYRLAEKNGKLVITNIEPTTRENREEPSFQGLVADEPWNFTPLRVIQAGSVWLAGDRTVTDLDRYARVAEEEERKVQALWGDRIRFPGHVMFLSRDPATLRKWYDIGESSNYMESIEGYQIPRVGVRKNGTIYASQYSGARIVVNLRNVNMFSGGDPRAVMRHELVHAVTSRAKATAATSFTGHGAPTWAIEGFATWATSMERPADRAQEWAAVRAGLAEGRFHGRLPLSKTFYSGDARQRYFNYMLGMTVFAFVEKLKGRAATVEFYASVVSHNDMETPFVELPAFDGICRRVVGRSSDAFLREWAAFVRRGA